MDQMPLVCYGFLGGIIAEFLDHYHQRKGERPKCITSGYYWINVIFMVLAGGFIVYLYRSNGTFITPILAINVGATAPFILASATGKKQQISE